MDEATKKALNEFVQTIIAAAQSGAQWTVEQTPILVQEWLTWQLVMWLLWMLIWATPLVLSIVTWKRTLKYSEDADFPIIVLNGLGLVFFFPMLVCFGEALKVLIAPRVVVLEKFMELLK